MKAIRSGVRIGSGATIPRLEAGFLMRLLGEVSSELVCATLRFLRKQVISGVLDAKRKLPNLASQILLVSASRFTRFSGRHNAPFAKQL